MLKIKHEQNCFTGKAIDFPCGLCMLWKKKLGNWNDVKGGNTEFNFLQFWLNVQGVKICRVQLSCKSEKEEYYVGEKTIEKFNFYIVKSFLH